jgi:hypothetical protein
MGEIREASSHSTLPMSNVLEGTEEKIMVPSIGSYLMKLVLE